MEAAIQPVDQIRVVSQVSNEAQLIHLWIKSNNSPNTRIAYTRILRFFLAYVGKSLKWVTMQDMDNFKEHISSPDYRNTMGQGPLKPASINLHLAAVKSLLTYAHDIGFIPFNVGRAIPLLEQSNDLAARILDEVDILRIIALETEARNHAILSMLYYSGARVSELCNLTWGHLHKRDTGGQVSLFGKGGKSRTVKLPARMWSLLEGIRYSAADDSPVFVSKKGGQLDPSQIQRIVKIAADRAGIKGNVSPHWFRHCHASHSLDAGCPIHILKDSLGHSSLATTSRYAHARPNESSSDYLK